MKAYVIGKAGAYRNPALMSELEENFQIVVKDGYRTANTKRQLVAESSVLRSIGGSLTTGELGAALAHKAARDWLLKSKEPYLAIFEDDASLTGENLYAMFSAIRGLRGPWQLSLYTAPQDRLVTHLFQRSKAVRRSRIQPSVCVAYVISREAARLCEEDFISSGKVFEGVADASPGAAGLVEFYFTAPSLFEPLSGVPSIIDGSLASPNRSHPIPPYRGLGHLLSVLSSPDIPSYKKRGVLLLRLKPLKHLLSVEIFTIVQQRLRQEFSCKKGL